MKDVYGSVHAWDKIMSSILEKCWKKYYNGLKVNNESCEEVQENDVIKLFESYDSSWSIQM